MEPQIRVSAFTENVNCNLYTELRRFIIKVDKISHDFAKSYESFITLAERENFCTDSADCA